MSDFTFSAVKYLLLSILVILIAKDLASDNGNIKTFSAKIIALPIPVWPKTICGIFIFLSCFHCLLKTSSFPIHSIRMYASAAANTKLNSIRYRAKYYFYDISGNPTIINLRKEHITPFASWLNWRATNEFTFVANSNFNYMQANFDFLYKLLSTKIDAPLHIGIQVVNFNEQTVEFFPSIEKAQAKYKQINPDKIRLFNPRASNN